jgi:hypothetical protein
MLKPGFAPEEQYRSRGVQGPWTDVYALSATIYKCITGVTPEESVERVHEDQVKPPSMSGIPVDATQEAALMTGMAVLQKNRFQNVSELYVSLYGVQTGAPAMTHASVATPIASAPPVYASAPASVSTPESIITPAQDFAPTPAPAPATGKPKRMKKQKWIIAIACGLVAGILSFAWNSWQQSSNRADTPDRPAVSPPAIELPVATDDLTGTWVGIVGEDDNYGEVELTLNDNRKFYLLEIYGDDDGFTVYEGTYAISDSILKMTLQWSASVADFWDNGVLVYDVDIFSVETHISIDNNTLFIDSLGFGMTYEATLTKGVPTGLWSFEHREKLINLSTPESQSPRDTTHIATVTLGDFQEFGGFPDKERGWWSDGTGNLWSPYTARDFTDSRYLILEFDRKPYGDIEFAWLGDTNDWGWTTTSFTPQSRILIMDLALINGYFEYIQASQLKIFILCYDDSWDSLVLMDAYFANAR